MADDPAIWSDAIDGWQAFARWSVGPDGGVVITFELPYVPDGYGS